jgi:membrane protein implicated in regulation of membrane protease activity
MNWRWWLVVFLGFLVLELGLPGSFIFLCMAGGALAACVAEALGASFLWGWGLFLGGAVALVAILAPVARRWLRRRRWRAPAARRGVRWSDSGGRREPDPEALLGRRARVIEGVDPRTGRGRVELSLGGEWPAVAQEPIPAGTWVEVLAVHRGRVQVRAVARPAPGRP